MARFHYKAANPAGQVISGEIDARDEHSAAGQVQAMGLIPISIRLSSGSGSAGSGNSIRLFSRHSVSQKHLGELTRELATLLRSGLTLDRALDILIGMSHTPALKSLMTTLRDDVRGGLALSKAMAGFPDVFDRFYLGMIRAGEAGGALGSVLERISAFMERSKELRDIVSSALIYPAILVFAAAGSVLLLLIFVVPQFSEMFEQSGQALPLPTQLVIGAGEWLRSFWWSIPLVSWLIYQYFRWQFQSPERKLVLDRRLLRLSLIGDLIVKVEVARFSRTLGALLTNGQPLLQALTIVIDTVENRVLATSLAAAREQLKAGQGLSKPLMSQAVFPPLAVHMIGVGEETGRLDEMLVRIADVYDREVALAVKRMLALLEPVLILGLGLIIGGIIVSILLAILKVNSLVG